MMFWLTKHGLDGDALLSYNPTAWLLTRMPLNRVRWMDCGLDQAGAPTTTLTTIPYLTYACERTITNANTHTDQCTYTSSSKESVYSCKVKYGKEETNYTPDRWLGMWEAWSFFLLRFENLLLSAAENWSPPLQPSGYGTVHFKGALSTTVFGCWCWEVSSYGLLWDVGIYYGKGQSNIGWC